MYQRAFNFLQAWYNFIKPHKSLKLKIDSGKRKWFQRTPAMVKKITDDMWSLKELLTFVVPLGNTTEKERIKKGICPLNLLYSERLK